MIKRNIVAELADGKCDDAKAKILKSALEEFSMLPLSAVRTRQIASKAGVNAVVQPGGSIKDNLSIDYCNENGIAMVTTGIRHFKH